MFIITTKEIRAYKNARCSKMIRYAGTDYVIAEIERELAQQLTELEMTLTGMEFWWQMDLGAFDPNLFWVEQGFRLLERIEWAYNVSKPRNVGLVVYTLATHARRDPIEFWNSFAETVTP